MVFSSCSDAICHLLTKAALSGFILHFRNLGSNSLFKDSARMKSFSIPSSLEVYAPPHCNNGDNNWNTNRNEGGSGDEVNMVDAEASQI